MGYGVSVPNGSIAVFSVNSEEDARKLLVATCPTNISGEFVAPELVEEQTLENLSAFSNRLAAAYARIFKEE